MFDLGWSEMLLIGIVALIVVGPKDLPGLFRSAGQFMGKARGMAREFSRAMEAAADESGVREVEKTLRAAANPKAFGTQKLREATGFAQPSATEKGAAKSAMKPGGATEKLSEKLSEDRAAMKDKISQAAAQKAEERRAREAAVEAAEASDEPEPEVDPGPAAPDPAAPDLAAPVPAAPRRAEPVRQDEP